MTGDRGRGLLLYATAALLLAGGGTWWVRAAPHDPPQPSFEQWRRSAERLLPDLDDQDQAGTLMLDAGTDHEVLSEPGEGEIAVVYVCVGGAGSQVRISLGRTGDSGHGLACSGDVQPNSFKVGVAGALRMKVSVNDAGPVIFRYSLLRTAPD